MRLFRLAGLLAGLASLATLAMLAGAQAQPYPVKPVKVLVATAAGGPVDYVARVLADGLTTLLGQQFYVENRGGAAGNLAVSAAVRSPEDGYTLLVAHASPIAINQTLMENKPPYDAQRDLLPIMLLAELSDIAVVRHDAPYNTLQEFIAYAKKNPGKLNYSSTPVGNMPYLATEKFKLMTGIDIVNVPYRSAPEAITAVIAGDAHFTFATIDTLELVKAGKLKALATTTQERLKDAPQVPTMAEAGVPGFTFGAWFAFFAPSGLPPDIQKVLNAKAREWFSKPEVREGMEKIGLEPMPGSPDDLAKYVDREIGRWKEVIQATGLKIK